MKFLMAFKQIHSSCSSFSSSDVNLKQILKKKIDFVLEVGKTITSNNYPFLNGETIKYIEEDKKFLCVNLEADKTFYNRAIRSDDHSKTDEFKNLVQKYIDAGWDKGKRYPEEDAYSERCKVIENKRLKKAKVVLWMGFEQYKGHPELFQGGFSDAVFNSPELSNYVKSGMCYGWIGNSEVRTAAHDKQIEKGLRKRGISDHKMYNWISSGSGRHFANSLEGYTKQEQKEKIEKQLAFMYNDCIIYGSKSHEGTMKSTNNINQKYDELGILLDSKVKYNKQKHINALMNAKEKVTLEIEKADTEEVKSFYEEISNVISEIFGNLI
jgi:hypothetical protein